MKRIWMNTTLFHALGHNKIQFHSTPLFFSQVLSSSKDVPKQTYCSISTALFVNWANMFIPDTIFCFATLVQGCIISWPNAGCPKILYRYAWFHVSISLYHLWHYHWFNTMFTPIYFFVIASLIEPKKRCMWFIWLMSFNISRATWLRRWGLPSQFEFRGSLHLPCCHSHRRRWNLIARMRGWNHDIRRCAIFVAVAFRQ